MLSFYSTTLLAGVAFLVGFAILFSFVLTLRTIAVQQGEFKSKSFRLLYKAIEKNALKYFVWGNIILGALIGGAFVGFVWLAHELPLFEILPSFVGVAVLSVTFLAAVFCFYFYLFNCWRLLEML